jgi:hypothetical protein
MHLCSKAQFIVFEGAISADASDIGLAPGEWPDFIAVEDTDPVRDGLFNPVTSQQASAVLLRRGAPECSAPGVVAAMVYWAGNVPVRIYND